MRTRARAIAGLVALLAAGAWAPAVCAQEVNLDSRVSVQFSTLRFNRSEHVYLTSATITNTSPDVLLEPMSLVVTSLMPSVTVANASGQTTDGFPFVSVPLTGRLLGPGDKVAGIDLKFRNPSNFTIQFTASVRGALSVVETVLQTSGDLVGVAVASDGTVYASNAKQGEIFKVPPAGSAVVVATGLKHPSGLALLGADLLIAEEKNGRVLRLTPGGALAVFASGMKTPRWLAVAHDGTVYITAHRLLGPDGSDPDEAKVIIRRDPATTQMSVVATDIRKLGAMALNGIALFAAGQRQESLPTSKGVILRYPFLPDGTLGAPAYFVSTNLNQPEGLALDALAALYTTANTFDVPGDKFKNAIIKVHPDAHMVAFAAPLADPRGLALGPDGSLFVADGNSGRLARFRAPAAPALDPVPAFTSQSPIIVSGTTVPGARVDIFVNDATTPATGPSTPAGAFSLPVPLVGNTRNVLEVFATARLGDGLTGAPAGAAVAHDNQPPTVTFLAPPANAWLRRTVQVQAQASAGGGSAVASLAVSAAGQPLSVTLDPAPPAPMVTATASWDTTSVADGSQPLTAVSSDAAGNGGSATRPVLVDNTPPQVQITGGPSGQIATTTATFTFTGTDNLTPVASLVFAWRMDGGAYTPVSAAPTASVSGLADGQHLFEVKARDLAGNDTAPPASRSFTVATGVALTITSVTPSSGPIGTAVTITGTGFVPGGTSLRFNGVPAIVQTNTGSALTTSVPLGATTGPLTVTTAAGSAGQTFTVSTSGDFTLSAAPAAGRAVAGDQAAVSLRVAGTGTFTSLVTLGVSGAPAGVTASLSQPVLAPGGSASLTLAVAGTVAPGTYGFTVTGQAPVDGRTLTRAAAVTLDVLAVNTPAVTGRVMTAEAVPLPIPGVTITLGAAFTLTDAAGNFVLLAPPPGANMLLVDGRTASNQTAQYPPVEVNIPVSQTGPTRVPFIIYLPKLDTANAINLPTDPNGTVTQTVQATTPTIPGLMVTIPAGTRIIGPDGNPVTQLIITPVPIDRSPMPYPPGVNVPLLFSIQPGGAVPSQPLPITFPNIEHLPAGTRATLYFFDLIAGNWATWGTGTVSADQSGVVSDPGFGLPRFAWHFFTGPLGGGDDWANDSAGSNPGGGDPVNLATGRFDLSKTDLVIPGRLSIAVARTYRGENQGFVGSFGIGWNLDPYDAILFTSGVNVTLLRADRHQYIFTPSGVNRWINGSAPFLAGSVITPGPEGLDLRFKDGTIHRFRPLFGFVNGYGLAAVIDRNGNTVTLTRVPFSPRIAQITEPAGRSLRFTYDTQNRLITASDSIGRLVQYNYDALGRMTSVTDPVGGVTRYAYDSSHRIVSITDPKGITYLTNQYDANGRVIRQTQADGGAWQFSYAVIGGIVTSTTATDPRGNATVYRFDGRGFTLSRTDALGQTTAYDYTPGPSFQTGVTDPLGRVTRFAYDAAGNVLSTTRLAGTPQAQTWTYTYEPTFQQVQTITDPLNHTTTFGYDTRGNLTSITDPRGKVTTLTYGGQGQPLTIRDPLGETSTLTYDATGDLATVQDPLGKTTARRSDGVGRLITLTDPLGSQTHYAWDALNRLTGITDALNGLTQFGYDPNGNVLSVTDARGNRTTYAQDNMDRVQTRTDALLHPESYTYDPNGNLHTFTDRKGQGRTNTYDALDHLTRVDYVDGSLTTYTRDAGNRLAQITDSISGTITRIYDSRDRMIQEVSPQGTVGYTFDNANRRTSLTVLGQSALSYTYDNADQLTTLTQGTASVTIGYDDANRRTNLTLPNGVQATYAYDAANRLISIMFTNGATTLGTLSYTYDAAGRRTAIGGTWARTGLPNAVASAAYNGNNQQTAWGGQTNTFDLNGNLISDGTNTYTWDARDRLAGSSGGVTASFTYDPTDRRASKTIAGTMTKFVYDDANPVQELSGAGAVLANILTGLGIDEYFTRTDELGRRTLLGDALGSILALTDDAGAVQSSYTYEPFGNTLVSGQANSNPFQYTGRENDGSGFYYYRARYYHPTQQRFVSEDPMNIQGGDVNLYSYVRQDPIRFVDPLGLEVTLAYYPTLATHLGIAVNDNASVGFYPANGLYGLLSILGVNVPGTVRQDTGIPARVVIIKTTPEQDRIIQDAINGRMTNPRYYNLYGRNCALFVSDVLRAGGVAVPRGWLPETIVNKAPSWLGTPSQ